MAREISREISRSAARDLPDLPRDPGIYEKTQANA